MCYDAVQLHRRFCTFFLEKLLLTASSLIVRLTLLVAGDEEELLLQADVGEHARDIVAERLEQALALTVERVHRV